MIQFIVVYYGFPLLSPLLSFSITTIAILCVGLYHGAYISEVVRSGIGAVPRGQFEAAYSQGLTYGQTMRYVILPQAWRIMLPPLTNQVVNLIKNTSTVAIISGADVMFAANSWSSVNLNYIPAFALAGFLYFILCFPLANLARKMEEKIRKHIADRRKTDAFSEEMRQLLTANNFQFLFNGLKLTLYISFVSIILSTIFGTILAVLRNQTHGPLKLLASIYVEVVRNIPNLLWIYVIFDFQNQIHTCWNCEFYCVYHRCFSGNYSWWFKWGRQRPN